MWLLFFGSLPQKFADGYNRDRSRASSEKKRCYFKEKDIIDWAKSHDLMGFDGAKKSKSLIEYRKELKAQTED